MNVTEAEADVLALNRIVGLGIKTPATRQQLTRLIDIAELRTLCTGEYHILSASIPYPRQ